LRDKKQKRKLRRLFNSYPPALLTLVRRRRLKLIKINQRKIFSASVNKNQPQSARGERQRGARQKFRRMAKGIWWMPWDIEATKDVA